MSRLWDLVIGGGIVVCLLALVACAVHMVLEVLAVEASRRKDAGRGQSAGARPDAAVAAVAPPPGVDAAARVVAELEGRGADLVGFSSRAVMGEVPVVTFEFVVPRDESEP